VRGEYKSVACIKLVRVFCVTAFDMELDAQNGIVLLCTAMLPCSGSRSHKECENHVHSFELSHLITYPWNDTVVKASENRFDTKTSESVTPCGICGGKSGTGTFL
jgi:hypothetical protein